MSVDKQQILETLTAVSRLITLPFKPKGTKIAIRDHNLVLCEPKTDTYYGLKIPQSVDRYWNGDSREDIFILNPVICNFIDWYIIPCKTTEPEIYKGLINMAKYLCISLRDLQTTYKTGTAVGTLQYYIIVLTAVIEDKFYPDMLYNASSSERKSFLDEGDNDESNMIYSTIFDVDKFKTFWSKDELTSLCSQFEKCFKNCGEIDIVVFKDITLDLDITKRQSFELRDNSDTITCPTPLKNSINNDTKTGNSSSPNDEHKIKANDVCEFHNVVKTWPTPKSLGNVIVQGHLMGITNILNIMDKKFTAMLNQSVKGIH